MNALYTPFIGIPLCIMCMAIGVFFFCTIIGIPIGLTFFALGNKVLTLNPAPIRP